MINDTGIEKYVLECKECNNQNDKPYVIDVDKLKICIFRNKSTAFILYIVLYCSLFSSVL